MERDKIAGLLETEGESINIFSWSLLAFVSQSKHQVVHSLELNPIWRVWSKGSSVSYPDKMFYVGLHLIQKSI